MKLSTLALAPITAALLTFNASAKGHDHDNQRAIFFPGETVQDTVKVEVEPSATQSLKLGQKIIICMSASLITAKPPFKNWARIPTG